jgi:protocatechuate 3,4-dioxygenase beta subunit
MKTISQRALRSLLHSALLIGIAQLGLAACRALGVEAKIRLCEDSFSTIRGPIVGSLGQESAEKWTAQADLQPGQPKSDRLLAFATAAPEPPRPAEAIGLTPWQGLPALDPLHVYGPHAGARVCPMCRYGYDAGVLVVLPADTHSDEVAAIAARLLRLPPSAADSGEDVYVDSAASAAARFRRFVLFAGAPSADALGAAAQPGLQVALLDGRWLQEAEAALARPVRESAWGYVFAQRRLLYGFDPLSAATQIEPLQAHARYALQLLAEHYPQPLQSDDPDLPRGLLWMAPNRLGEVLHAGTGDSASELCFERIEGQPVAHALVEAAVAVGGPMRLQWASSRADGCVRVLGDTRDSLGLRVFEPLQPTLKFDLPANELAQAQVRVLRAASEPPAPAPAVPVLGPCEGCERALLGLPTALSAQARIAAADTPGTRLRIEGVVRNREGAPVPGVLVYAYQTDSHGRYPQPTWLQPELRAHGALRGWAVSDAAGRYRFDTVRPGAYPEGGEPEHVHMHLIEPGRCTYYLDDLVFADDPLLHGRHRRDPERARGGSGIVQPQRDDAGGWRVVRDLVPGENIEGYARCGET